MAEQGNDLELQRAIGALVVHAYRAIDNGQPQENIESELMSRGCSREVAAAIIRRAREERQRIADSGGSDDRRFREPEDDSGSSDMWIGAVICLAGILITALTYSSASGGGTYVVAWGAIIFGAVRFFKGAAGG